MQYNHLVFYHRGANCFTRFGASVQDCGGPREQSVFYANELCGGQPGDFAIKNQFQMGHHIFLRASKL